MASTTINNFVISFVLDEMKILNIAKEQCKTINEIVSDGSKVFKSLPR
jgi:hypothetical protein